MSFPNLSNLEASALLGRIESWSNELGFDAFGVSDIHLEEAETHLLEWLAKGFHGAMSYMEKHGHKRTRPDQLIPGTLSVLSLRMNYLPEDQANAIDVLHSPDTAYVSRYALGRDYHKLIRARLQKLATKIQIHLGDCEYRVFTDSAPVMEKPLASKAGLGWVGKHSNLLNREAGSWFFLGEIYLNFCLPQSPAKKNHCGQCTSCIDVCPTKAIVEPYVVDARKCISYLTIENKGEIPLELRPKMGNRIYGCDDCQLFCPWNRFAKLSREVDFLSRHKLDSRTLAELFLWEENTFLKNFEGSPVRRIGYQAWLRNIAVALGNASKRKRNFSALLQRKNHPDPLVKEHIDWAIEQQAARP